MKISDILHIAKRRDMRTLNTHLAALTPGDRVTALFRSEMYGPFAVSGVVVRSCATGGLLVGGYALDTASESPKPVPDLVKMTIAPIETSNMPIALADLNHGDLVHAHFDQHPYGSYTVTGFARDAPVGRVFVLGARLLTRPGSRLPTAHFTEIQRITDSHAVAVPARIVRWPEPDGD
ncbi:hypothetical protein [Nocardia sp. A7]|uniref:hypothetical protein n=1 Tax=Nocardia sp. A7 TaxID=2789274 RepID=UPI00397A6AA5